MKLFFVSIILLFFYSCSFDDKTGIWKNENISKEKDNIFKDFEKLSIDTEVFNKTIIGDKEYKFSISKRISNSTWSDIFFNENNNFKNFEYENLNEISYKSKKLSKYNLNQHILYDNDNIITSDINGNLIINSLIEKFKTKKFNFYKRKYKKIEKQLNLVLENETIFVSDNLGYLYAYDYKKEKIIWAKNYKVPFRSNIKIINDKLVAANQNNNLYFFSKADGNILKSFPTEETIVKNDFINNISSNKKSIFFLNTFGTLYSINKKSLRLNWFVNLNQTLDLRPSNTFLSNQIVNNEKKIVISSRDYTYLIDSNSGSIIQRFNFVSNTKPLILDDYLFLISNNSFLISLELKTGKIIYSYDLNEKISNFYNVKKRKIFPKNIAILSDNIYIFLENSYLIKFDIFGDLLEINKLPSKLRSFPIFVKKNIIFLNKKKKIIMIN